MKKGLTVLLCLLMILSVCHGEDAVSSATLAVDRLPETASGDSRILVAYFSTDDTVRAAETAVPLTRSGS